MKIGAALVLVVLLFALAFQIYSFWGRERALEKSVADLQGKLDKTTLDAERFRAELEYLARPQHLEKELRARFNYREPDETMIIIVPQSPSGTPSGTSLE